MWFCVEGWHYALDVDATKPFTKPAEVLLMELPSPRHRSKLIRRNAMADPFLGQISTFGFNFAPHNWSFCNGAILPVNQNQALFSLLYNSFGGDGSSTFALPNLQGRAPMHYSAQFSTRGAIGGSETEALTINTMPAHNHMVKASNEVANLAVPNATFYLAQTPSGKATAYAPYASGSASVMGQQSVSNVGEGTPHNNMQPYLAINFCIAMQGYYPSRN